jgi:twinkle protein
MDDSTILPQRKPGSFHALDLPQRGSIDKIALGSGWPELDSLIKFYPGQFVLVTGMAGQGKSTFMMNVLAKMAIDHGVGPFMYIPENEGSFLEKMSLLWPGDEISFHHFCKSQCIVQSAVPYQRLEPFHTIDWALDSAEWSVTHDHCEIVFLDPWNEFDRIRGKDQLMTDYIGESIMLIKQFCRSLKVPVIMVAHPTKAVIGREVGLADTEGSMNWYNKCDNGLVVSRTGMDTAKVVSQKVRERGAGKVGQCEFKVDPDGKFTPIAGSDIDVIA